VALRRAVERPAAVRHVAQEIDRPSIHSGDAAMSRIHPFLAIRTIGLSLAIALTWTTAGRVRAEEKDATTPEPITSDTIVMVVMDPLAKPLSCPCVQGYAQRDYDMLGQRLGKDLGRPVRVVYSESLPKALKGEAQGRATLVIGKHSVVAFDAKRSKLGATPVARLTGKDGATTQTGLVVVPKDDPALTVADLAGYRIIFGCVECDEKHAAALALLKKNGVAVPQELETSPACSDGASLVIEEFKADKSKRGAALISSYAKPLLEGCGNVEKGALRVIGQTEPVPFIEAFITDQAPRAQRAKLVRALIHATTDPELRIALETKNGFVAIGDESASKAAKKKS
jgi:ABC-type phosphate/phosphonate transport system substrate-binding protein